MRRRRWVRDQTFRIPKIVRDIDKAERVEKPEASRLVASNVAAHDATAQFHLALGEFVLRVARQPGIEHACNLRMGFENARDRLRGAALPFDPEFQRLQPFEQQPGVERRKRRAGVPIELTEIVL